MDNCLMDNFFNLLHHIFMFEQNFPDDKCNASKQKDRRILRHYPLSIIALSIIAFSIIALSIVYSTVTLLARFLGLSTSTPLAMPT